MLALLALLGFAAIYEVGAGKIDVFGQDGKANAQLAVPHFFDAVFPTWFAGVAFAAIAIGALVPAAIMSIAAANLFTRNIYREFLKPDAVTEARGTGVQDRLADGEVRRAAVRPRPRPAERAQHATARRRLDPADVPGDRRRAVHPLVPPVGAAARLGGRDGLRHDRGVSAAGAGGSHQARRRRGCDRPTAPGTSAQRWATSRSPTRRSTSRPPRWSINICSWRCS